MINLGHLLRSPTFGPRAITLLRPTTTVIADGSADDGLAQNTYATSTITAVKQPAKPDDLKLLPEGTRLDAVVAVWSESEIRSGNGVDQLPDVLDIDGERYQALRVSARPESGFYKALCVRYAAGDAPAGQGAG